MNNTHTSYITYPGKFLEIDGNKMHYIEIGEGDPLLFLHGIPASSYLWRNILPHLAVLGRCIAPDFIGFGWSDKPSKPYDIVQQFHYLEKFIAKLALTNLTIVMHGWGSLLGFQYANQHEKNCKGLVFYEAFLPAAGAQVLSLPCQEQLHELQEFSRSNGLSMHAAECVNRMFNQFLMRDMPQQILQIYREPFLQPGAGKSLEQYLQEMLDPADKNVINHLITENIHFLERSLLPKLMLYSVPGFFTTMAAINWAKKHFANLEVVELGEEFHLAQETYPALMGEIISVWLQGIEQITK